MTTARHRLAIALLALVPLAVLSVFFLWPIGGMLDRGLRPDGTWALDGVAEVFGRGRTQRVLWFTIWSAAAATMAALIAGLPAAFALYRLQFPGQALLRAIVMVPFVLPTIVVGVAFDRIFDDGGALAFLDLHGSAVAIVAALAFFNVSVVVRTVGSYWEGLDPRPEEAAAALGASPVQVFLSVTLPALRAPLAAAASVVFLFCATSFGVVLTMGGLRHANVETEIYQLTTQELDLTGAAALSLLQLLLISALLLLIARLRRDQQSAVRAAAARPPRLRDWPVLLMASGVVAYVLFPVLTLVWSSLRADGSWSLRNYRNLRVVNADLPVSVSQALATSLVLALQAVLFSMVLGLIVSFIVSRPGGRLISIFDGLFMLPLGVSAVTLGFGFLITLNRAPFDLRTSAILIPIAQALVALPLVVRTIAPVWRSIEPAQREVAATMGASPWRVFASVDLPLAWRPTLAATGFAFAVSLGEFGATSFLAREGDPTLPVLIYRLLGIPHGDAFGMAMAASVVLAAATALVMFAVERLRVASMGAF